MRRSFPFVFALLGLALILAACQPAPTPPPPATATRPAGTPTRLPASATPIPTPTGTAIPTTAPTETPAPTATAAPAEPAFDPEAYTLVRVAAGLERPVFLTHAGDDRLFVLEQPGRIRIVRAGQLVEAPFLDFTDRVGSSGNEQGLLGLAFHPRYAENGYFYVDYTGQDGNTVVARYAVSGDPDRADPASAQVILQVDQPYANHNGGDLAFGPDGYLYIGLGDGGSAGDPQNNAQNLQSLLGKLLRVDVDTAPPYSLPADNPFLNSPGARPEIWALGLRNPWRFSFDRLTGDLYIADVGQNAVEEVDFQAAGSPGGANYGWRFFEGTHAYQDAGAAPPGLVPPVAEYLHAEGGCAVTGGYVYRGPALPALDGVYLFADYCLGQMWSLTRDAAGAWQRRPFYAAGFQISSFGEDAAGELYVLSLGAGAVYQLAARP